MSELSELRAAIEALSARVVALEDELRAQRERSIDADTLRVIAAAVAAYLGHRAKIKQVHFHTGRAWAQAGRSSVQRRQITR